MELNKLGVVRKNIIEHSQADQIKDEIQSAYDAVKLVKTKLKTFGKTNKEMSTLKKALRNMVDELEDLEDLDLEGMEDEEEDEISNKNEQSEGYGTWKGLGMEEQIIKLSESDLNTLYKVVAEVGSVGGGRDLKYSDNRMTVSEDINNSVRKSHILIRKAIINEGIRGLRLGDYGLMTEQSEWGGRNPGVSAAAGIENIIDNLKKGWAMIEDSTTRKQIQNTLTKLNNFMMYSAELVGSGSSQTRPRSYDQLANPLPYPELDEPEELEDIDDGLEDFDSWMDDLSDRNGTTDY